MTTNYVDAIDELFGIFITAWRDQPVGLLVGSWPPIYWQGKPEPDIPDSTIYWVRMTQKTIDDEQATMQSNIDGSRRWTNSGILMIEIFCPLSKVDFMQVGRQLAVIARDAYRGVKTATSILIRNPQISEEGIDQRYKKSYKFAIMVEYEYDEIK